MKRNLLGISLLTMTGLYVMLSAVIILVALLCNIPVIYGIITSIIILIIQFLISPFLTDLSMKWFYKAKFNYELPDYLKKFIEEVCKNQNMKYPRIGFIDDGAPNAFTYGHVKNNARIIITRGILDLLDEDEVKAVVGHELGHAVHYDMLFMTVAQLVPLILYGIYEMFISSAESNNSKNNGGAIVAIIAYVLYVISNYIVLWLSRTREYYADSFSIEATKKPNSLASALVKIGYGLTTIQSENKKHSVSKSNALGIFDAKTSKSLIVSSYDDGEVSKDNIKQAMKWEEWNIWAKWFQLNSTHPLISKRLLAISERSKEFNQEPYITFDLEKPESYLDDFLVELVINFLPLLSIIIGIVFFIVMTSLENDQLSTLALPVTFLVFLLTSFIKFQRRHPNRNYKESTVRDLLSEVKVSGITAIPCTLEGEIIGRGDPGCIFNEDMTIKDSTGIIFLDYNQPLFIINIIFALFRNQQNIGKKVKVTGWYRRSPVPYIEIKTYELDGKLKKVFTYPLMITLYIVGLILGVFLLMSVI